MMVKAAQNWRCKHPGDMLDLAWDRRVLIQRQVDTDLVVIALICVEQMAQVHFAEHNNVVKAIPPD